MTLGEKLLELRKKKGLSQEEVADLLHVTRQTVSKWETNQSTPDFDKIVPICELYEISTEELFRNDMGSTVLKQDDTFSNYNEQQEKYLHKKAFFTTTEYLPLF